MKAARTKIGRIRLKSGGEVRLLKAEPEDERRAEIELRVRQTLDAQGEFSGFIMVVWGPNGTSTANRAVWDDSRIPTALVPDFVRGRLLAQLGAEWGANEALERLGYDPAAG